MSDNFITFRNTLNTKIEDIRFLQDCMNEILDYQVKRFTFLKNNNQLGKYNKNLCDLYRNNQTYINFKQKENTILDARYTRAIDIDIQARCLSIIENAKNSIEIKEIKLEKKERNLERKKNEYKEAYQLHSTIKENINKDKRTKRHDYIERLKSEANKEKKEINVLKNDLENDNFKGIVFGGKWLWKEQFKEGVNQEEWLKNWRNRANEFNCAGAQGENYGNKQFQLSFSKNQSKKGRTLFNLQINVPNQLRKQYGNTYIIKDIYFPRGQEEIMQNVLAHTAFLEKSNRYQKIVKRIEKTKETIEEKNKRERNKARILKVKPKATDFDCSGVSIMIKKDKAGKMGLRVSIERKEVPIISHDRNGVIGIDINHSNISMSEIDRNGKLLHSKVLRFNFGNNNKAGYRDSLINKHIKYIIGYAKRQSKNIVIEKLDFLNKKAQQLKGLDKYYNRMLHTLAYARITSQIELNGFINGIAVTQVRAEYTSMLGKTLYCAKYGISVHQAAAYIVARRYYNFLENYDSPKIEILYKSKKCQLEMPEDIFKMQSNTKKTAKFKGKLYNWLSCGLKAPKIFLRIETFPPRVNQPTHTSCQSK